MTLDKRIEICYAVFVSMKEAIGRECPAFFMVFFFLEVFLMAMNRKSGLYSLLVTAILLAVGIVLPFLTGNVQVLGQAISPLHIPDAMA